jgi:TetR/AcrR family transcriptional regulator, repressor of fatR-cypB operon
MARERKFSTDELFKTTKQLLLDVSYEAFTFSLLAERLHVARGTLYKYHENKDELITEFMVYEMQEFLIELKQIETIRGFEPQFDFLLSLIFNHSEVTQIRGMVHQIPKESNEKVKENLNQLEKLHLEMYKALQTFVDLGREERILKQAIPDALILGFIFQTIAIPNHFGVPHEQWVESIKHIIGHGMFTGQ